MPEKRDRLGEV